MPRRSSQPKRPYIKRDTAHWEARSSSRAAVAAPPVMASPLGAPQMAQAEHMEGAPCFDEMPSRFEVKAGACGPLGGGTTYRDGVAPSMLPAFSYPNIMSGLIPYTLGDDGYYGVSEAINLCYAAYFNFALLRNAVKLLRDFSVSPIHVKTTNQRVKTFIETWLSAVGMNAFLMQFFLEYYRSGNVFVYKFSGKIDEDGMNMLKRAYSAEGLDRMSPTVPIRYIILNPTQVYLQLGPVAPYSYVRMLSTYEIQRLKNPQTQEDLQVLESMPEAVKQQIKSPGTYPYLYIPLDPARLFTVFYDKMDYEPLAVPMAFPVLPDIEYKLGLRRMDMALAAQVERMILLVTTGRPADQWNKTPKSNIEALQQIFSNQTIGRVLVADYTTKAEWIIPDFKELLGSAKYQQVDKDIKEGLQYMFFGEEKFANASIKVKIFIEGLKEGRRAFMEGFLIPEVKKVCEQMGFRNVPEIAFEDIMIEDQALMNRLYVQMAQLGLLTAAELNEAMSTGMLPTPQQSLEHQEAYRAERKKGLYTPLAPEKAEGAGSSVGKGRPGGTGGTPATRKVATPIGQQKVRGGLEAALSRADARGAAQEGDTLREGRWRFGLQKVAENIVSLNGLRGAVEEALARKWKLKDGLGAEERGVATSIAQAIAFNETEGVGGKGWVKAIPAYLKQPKDLPAAVAADLLDIRATFDTPENPVDGWMATVLLRSQMGAA